MRSRKFATAFAMVFALATVAACGSDGLFGSNRGRVRVVLSGDGGSSAAANLAGAASTSADLAGKRDDDQGDDDERPSHWFRAANVTLSSILVRNLSGELVNLDLDLPVAVDVVQIENGRQIQLPDGALPIGEYDQVVVVITAVQGVMRDGTIITLEPPGGGWTSIIPICSLDVVEGGTTTVGIDLMVRNAFRWSDNRFHFQPRFRSATNCS